MQSADLTGFPYGTYDVEVGDSFANQKSSKRSNVNEFHTLRYDFKPKSVAGEQEAYVGMADNNDVQVVVPSENGDSLTVYKGSKKVLQGDKECVLVFDHDSGKLSLERLSSNINVKKTRENDDSTNDNLKSEIQRVRAATGRHLPKESETPVQEQPSLPSPQPMELSRQSSSSSHSSSTSSASDSERENDDSNSDDDAQALENIVAQSAKPHPNAANASVMQDLYMSASDNSGSDTD
ncbi:RNA polymerase II transcription elongation factor domain-containing protein [Ditylenchus destructor]|uniref:Ell-associated factor Eaf n=1 Tax=Ditylenchus destructor TaxID=166010 RepID=A0AAD4MXC1_9BILA|nr:RNA polymerase II transcription elongation factor domain-containing protein [Ditylenchus destructor]